MIGIFTLIVLYSIFFYKQHSVKIALHLPSPFKNFWSQLKDPTLRSFHDEGGVRQARSQAGHRRPCRR